jgi:hypothetical protein
MALAEPIRSVTSGLQTFLNFADGSRPLVE